MAIDDRVDEAVASADVWLTSMSLDPKYENATIDQVSVTVVDNDVAGLWLSVSDLNISEGMNGSYLVRLASQPANGGAVIVSIETDQAELQASPRSLTFTALTYNKTQSVTIHGVDDLIDEGGSGNSRRTPPHEQHPRCLLRRLTRTKCQCACR